MKIYVRRSFLLLVLNALLLIMVPSAMADEPAEIPFDPIVFDDVDPCTGDLMEVTIFFDIFEHLGHRNNIVGRAVRTGFTNIGHELFAGNDVLLENNNVVMFRFKDMWRHDDGRMFQARGVFVLNFNTGEFHVDNFALGCVG